MTVFFTKRTELAILFIAFTLLFVSRALAGVPPDYVELTSAEMKSRDFKFKIQRDEISSSIDLRVPNVLIKKYRLAPHSTEVIVKNLEGEVIARTTNWVADGGLNSIVANYNPKVSDLSVSVTYACRQNGNNGCYGATTFSVSSVSKFIDANPEVVNSKPKCRRVTSNIIDCS